MNKESPESLKQWLKRGGVDVIKMEKNMLIINPKNTISPAEQLISDYFEIMRNEKNEMV